MGGVATPPMNWSMGVTLDNLFPTPSLDIWIMSWRAGNCVMAGLPKGMVMLCPSGHSLVWRRIAMKGLFARGYCMNEYEFVLVGTRVRGRFRNRRTRLSALVV